MSNVSHQLTTVKIYPRIGVEAIRRRVDRQYRFWVLLRAIDVGGSARIPIETARAILVEDLQVMSRSSFQRALKSPSTGFYNTSRAFIYLRSLQRVAEALETIPGNPVLIDIQHTCKIGRFRAEVLAARFPRQNSLSHPISLQRLADMCGMTTRTVWSYLRRAGVVVQHNALASTLPPVPPDAERAQEGWYRAGRQMRKRLPNSYYHGDCEVAPRGMARRVAKRIAGGTVDNGRRIPTPPVTFVAPRNAQQERQAISDLYRSNRDGDTLFLEIRRRRDVDGSHLWSGHRAVGGAVYEL